MSNGPKGPRHRGTEAPRQQGARARALRLLCLSVPLCLGASVPRLSAQVGHDPQQSPFQDITTKATLTPFISEFFGNKAHAGVGAQSGLAVGARFAVNLSGPLSLWVTGSYINSQRNVVDPSKSAATRVSGPIPYHLVSADLGVSLNLTGLKTWHGLAPYIGASFGIVAPTTTVTDPGGFTANANITFVPTIGTHVRFSRTVSLTIEARDYLMRYEWPLQYFFPTDGNGTAITPPVLDPKTEKDKQMTHNFSFSVGLSYHFNF